MKKKILIGAMMCWMALSAQAQYQYDRALPLPTRDLYDSGVMTMFYCGELFYIRGYAYEQLGNLKAAKKDYKTGKKYNCAEAAQALEALKAKRKAKK